MSSIAHIAKKGIAGMLQKLLGKLGDVPAEARASAPPGATPRTAGTKPEPGPGPSSPKSGAGGRPNGNGVELPLQPILAALPLELQPRLKATEVGSRTICVPLEKILAQLGSGAVKISFGELRQAAADLFTAAPDRDQVVIPIPLGEVLSRLNPALITRRREQKLVEVPADIRSPFDRHGQGLAFSVGPATPDTAPAPPQRVNAPAMPSAAVPPARSSLLFTPVPVPPAAPPLVAPALPAPPQPAKAPAHAQPTAPPTLGHTPAPVAARNTEALIVALTSIAEGWPEAVRKEIVQLSLVDAKVELPSEVVERALKQGRVAFTWKALRSWIKPPPLPAVSAHDGAVLELPLKIVAPLFLARQHEANGAKKKVAIDKDIPNLFFGFPQPDKSGASPAAAANNGGKPPDTNYYIWEDASDRARLDEDEVTHGPSPGTKFVAKYATPNEVVSRAAALDGVAGALIALPDGLMVASRLSSDLNGDTLAAFLPQIFAKVSQCTKELRMGELNNLHFTVGNVPWKIFRVNAIFFAAFGRPGEGLPTARLAALAAELDHKPR